MMSFKRSWFFDGFGVRAWFGVTVVLAVMAVLFGVLGVSIRHADAVSCRNKAAAMHRAYHSGFLEGCLVRLDDGTFIPLDNLRTTDLERTR